MGVPPGMETNPEAEARKALEIQKFQVADRNGDGQLDAKEVPAVFYPEIDDELLNVAAAFTHKQKDTDGSGLLTPKEFWEGDGIDGQDIAITQEEEASFRKLDKDGDGLLSVAEI